MVTNSIQNTEKSQTVQDVQIQNSFIRSFKLSQKEVHTLVFLSIWRSTLFVRIRNWRCNAIVASPLRIDSNFLSRSRLIRSASFYTTQQPHSARHHRDRSCTSRKPRRTGDTTQWMVHKVWQCYTVWVKKSSPPL